MTEALAEQKIREILLKYSADDYKLVSARRRRIGAIRDAVFFLAVVPNGKGGMALYKELRELEVTTRKITTISSDIARDDNSNIMVEHFVIKAEVER